MDRWETPFGAWVKEYGVARLRRAVQVTRGAVHQWVRGVTSPKPDTAKLLVKLSAGRLTLEHIYDQATLARLHWERTKEARA